MRACDFWIRPRAAPILAAPARNARIRSPARRRSRPASMAPRLCRALPPMRRHDELRALALEEIGPEHMPAQILARPRHADRQRRAGVEMPDLGRIDPVPMRDLTRLQQEIDRRRRRAAGLAPRGIAKRLAVEAALGVRPQIQQADDRRPRWRLRSMAAPRSCAVLAVAQFGEDGDGIGVRHADRRLNLRLLGAQKGIGRAFERNRRRQSVFAGRAQPCDMLRRARAGCRCAGSTPRANLALASVYSWPQ